MAFVKLDCGMLDSSIWVDRDAKDLFITALLMAVPVELVKEEVAYEVRDLRPTGFVVPAGWYGKVNAAGIGIVRRALIADEVGLAALERLGVPEPQSRTPDFEGRRMVRVDGGYIILNFAEYRAKDHTAAERSKRYREKKFGKVGKKSRKMKDLERDEDAREQRFVKAVESGDEALADRIVDGTEEA